MKTQTPDPAVFMKHVLMDDTGFRQKTTPAPNATVHLIGNNFKNITF